MRCADLAMYRAKTEDKAFAIYSQAWTRWQSVSTGGGPAPGTSKTGSFSFAISRSSTSRAVRSSRWRRCSAGPPAPWLIPPLEFLPLAEDADLMDQLTALVLDMALAQCSRWRDDGRRSRCQ